MSVAIVAEKIALSLFAAEIIMNIVELSWHNQTGDVASFRLEENF